MTRDPSKAAGPLRRRNGRHEAVRGQLSAYLDGSLGRSGHQRLEAHLAECPSCRAFGRALEGTVALAHQLPRVTMPADARDRLRRLVAASATGASGPHEGEEAARAFAAVR